MGIKHLMLAAAFTIGGLNASAHAQTRPPNIVIIVADDMGYADIGVHGSADIPTPNIDALAAAGIRFTDAYVSNPFCSPTRAGLLTGRYPQRFGYEFNLVEPYVHAFGLPLEERTIAHHLRAAGYRTALVGKWHLGSDARYHPLERGFDEFFGFLGGAHAYVPSASDGSEPLLEGRQPVRQSGYLTDVLTDRAIAFIRRQRSSPFFLYLAYNAVHEPLQATEHYLARFPNIGDVQRRIYAGMLSAMDDGIGRTMAALRAEGLEENTLIFFFSDNGGPTVVGGINGSSNTPLRGSKRQLWEGGIRVPFIISWKGRLPAAQIDSRLIIQLDIMPTALAAAGISVDPRWKLDGVNLLPFLMGQVSGPVHDALFWRLGAMMAIRQGDWKLVRMHGGPLRADSVTVTDLAQTELYNLAEDIAETRNLVVAHPDRVRELRVAWQRWNGGLARPRFGPPPQARERL